MGWLWEQKTRLYPRLEEVPVFVINLNRSRRRRLAMCQRLLREGLYGQSVFVAGIDATQEEGARLVAERRGFHRYPSLPLSAGEVACFMSHLLALRAFVATGRSYGLILEDDMLLCHGLAQEYEKCLPKKLKDKEGRNILMFCHYIASPEGWEEEPADRRWLPITGQTYSTGAYLIKREYAQECVEKFDRPWHQIQHPQQRFTSEHITLYSGGLCLKQPLAVEEAEDSHLRGETEMGWHREYYRRVKENSQLKYQ